MTQAIGILSRKVVKKQVAKKVVTPGASAIIGVGPVLGAGGPKTVVPSPAGPTEKDTSLQTKKDPASADKSESSDPKPSTSKTPENPGASPKYTVAHASANNPLKIKLKTRNNSKP